MESIVTSIFVKKAGNMIFDKIIPSMYKSVTSKFNELSFNNEEEFGMVYFGYLEKVSDKYLKIKTLLYKNTPKNLYSFFEPMNLKCDSHIVKDTMDSSNIVNINKKLFITGTGGMGKSMLMKHILLDTVNKETYIPIFIELKNLNNNLEESFLQFIYESISQIKINMTLEQFEYTLELGNYLFLLDGLDEVDPQIIHNVENQLKSFIDKYDGNHFIVSSRPSDTFIGWNEFYEYQLQPLSEKQAVSLISKLEYDIEIKKKFQKQLQASLYENHKSFTSIPLLLTIMLITYTDGGEIPSNLIGFYEQAYVALFYQHDASKSGFTRNMKTKNVLDIEQFKQIFSYVAFKSFFSSNIDVKKDDLYVYLNRYKERENVEFISSDYIHDADKSVCLLIREGNNFKFSHRSFQEYFAALYVERLNDSDQIKLFRAWVDKDPRVIQGNNVFIDTLLYKQEKRLIENLIFPIITNFENYFKNILDNSYENLYAKYISSVSVLKLNNEEKTLSFLINSSETNLFMSMFRVFFLILNKIDSEKDISHIYSEDTSDIKKELISKLSTTTTKSNKKVNIEKILSNPDYLSSYIEWCDSWYKPLIEFLIVWKSNYLKRHTSYKRTLDSLIDSW